MAIQPDIKNKSHENSQSVDYFGKAPVAEKVINLDEAVSDPNELGRKVYIKQRKSMVNILSPKLPSHSISTKSNKDQATPLRHKKVEKPMLQASQSTKHIISKSLQIGSMKPKSGQPIKIVPPKTEMDFRESFEDQNVCPSTDELKKHGMNSPPVHLSDKSI